MSASCGVEDRRKGANEKTGGTGTEPRGSDRAN